MKNNKSLFIMSIVSIVFAVAAVALLVISLLNNNDKFDTVGNDINNVNVSNKDLYAKLDKKNDDILKAEKDNKTAVMKLARSLSNDETEAISTLVSTESGVITTNINELKELILKENEAIKANVLENEKTLVKYIESVGNTTNELYNMNVSQSNSLNELTNKVNSLTTLTENVYNNTVSLSNLTAQVYNNTVSLNNSVSTVYNNTVSISNSVATVYNNIVSVSNKLTTMDGKLDSILNYVKLGSESDLYKAGSTFVTDINGWMEANSWNYTGDVNNTETLLRIITGYIVNKNVMYN